MIQAESTRRNSGRSTSLLLRDTKFCCSEKQNYFTYRCVKALSNKKYDLRFLPVTGRVFRQRNTLLITRNTRRAMHVLVVVEYNDTDILRRGEALPCPIYR